MSDMRQPNSPEEALAAIQELRARLHALEEAVSRMAVREGLTSGGFPPAPAGQGFPLSGPMPILEPVAPPPLPPRVAIPPAAVAPPPLPPGVPVPPVAAAAPPLPLPPAAPAPAAAARPAGSWEQKLGTRWMLYAGLAVLLLGGLFFFKFAIDQGWISPLVRVLAGAAAGLAMIGLGEWTLLRRRMRVFAAAVSGGGIVLLYFIVFLSSPNGWYRLIGSAPAFALMCAVTALGMGLSVQMRLTSGAVVALVGAMATPILLSTGENRQVFLMCYLLVVNAGFLTVALAMRWKALSPLALVGTAVIFAAWYITHFQAAAWPQTVLLAWLLLGEFLAYVGVGAATGRDASPCARVVAAAVGAAGLALWSVMRPDMPLAWYAACVTGLFAAELALAVWRNWRELDAVAAVIAGLGLGWLALDGRCGLPLLAGLLLGINAALLAAGLLKRWSELPLEALAVAFVVFAIWYDHRYDGRSWGEVTLWSWLVLAELLLYVGVSAAARRLAEALAQGLTVLAGTGATALWLAMIEATPASNLLASVLAVVLIALALGLWRNWQWVAAAAMAWSAAACGLEVLYRYRPDMAAADRWELSIWAWVFFAVFTVQVLVGAFWRSRPMAEYLYAAVATAAMAGMFGLTYGLLWGPHRGAMGIYAGALGAAAVTTAVVVRRLAGRRQLAYAYLGQGLVLLALAVPIHFDMAAVPIAWTVQGVVVMFLARRLRNFLLLIASPVLLALAAVHFFAYSLPSDERLAYVAFAWLGTDITFGLLLAWGLAAAALSAAALLRAGDELFEELAERTLAIGLVAAGFGVLAVRGAVELPTTGATWTWLVLAAGLAAWACWRRSDWLAPLAGLALLAAAAKWALFDTLGLRAAFGADTRLAPVANWQFAAGLAIAAALLAFSAGIRRRRIELAWPEAGVRELHVAVGILAAVLVVYAGTFEIDRYFAAHAWRKAYQAMHTAYSVWWAVSATALMVLGFALAQRPARYLALVLYALTLGKVFIVDMAEVQAAYRILSFVCLGALLVAGSWLYHRYFRERPAA